MGLSTLNWRRRSRAATQTFARSTGLTWASWRRRGTSGSKSTKKTSCGFTCRASEESLWLRLILFNLSLFSKTHFHNTLIGHSSMFNDYYQVATIFTFWDSKQLDVGTTARGSVKSDWWHSRFGRVVVARLSSLSKRFLLSRIVLHVEPAVTLAGLVLLLLLLLLAVPILLRLVVHVLSRLLGLWLLPILRRFLTEVAVVVTPNNL